jgi:tRNA (guanine-N(7)-)-methyltransferase
MIKPLRIWMGGREIGPTELETELDRRRGTGARLEVEIGFGKGRYLLGRAAAEPEVTFVGIESAALYWGETTRRAERRGLDNLITICGDALYVLAVCLERDSASAVHVYFPDPWPKTRHLRRRLLDPATVDLVFGVLAPGGVLYFATDHAGYGAAVREVLERYPAAAVERIDGPWPDGRRTHYETKYEGEGRPILRLLVRRRAPAGVSLVHPDGAAAIAAGADQRTASPPATPDGPVE